MPAATSGGLSMQQPPQLQHAPQTIKPPMPPMLNPSMQMQNQQHLSPHQQSPRDTRDTRDTLLTFSHAANIQSHAANFQSHAANIRIHAANINANAGMPCQQQQQQAMVYMGGQHHLNVMPPQNQFLSASRNSSAVCIYKSTHISLQVAVHAKFKLRHQVIRVCDFALSLIHHHFCSNDILSLFCPRNHVQIVQIRY